MYVQEDLSTSRIKSVLKEKNKSSSNEQEKSAQWWTKINLTDGKRRERKKLKRKEKHFSYQRFRSQIICRLFDSVSKIIWFPNHWCNNLAWSLMPILKHIYWIRKSKTPICKCQRNTCLYLIRLTYTDEIECWVVSLGANQARRLVNMSEKFF